MGPLFCSAGWVHVAVAWGLNPSAVACGDRRVLAWVDNDISYGGDLNLAGRGGDAELSNTSSTAKMVFVFRRGKIGVGLNYIHPESK